MTSTLKRKKARVLPMKEEDMFIAQKTPELRVIVVGSELFANRFPWVTITNGGLDISCKIKLLKVMISVAPMMAKTIMIAVEMTVISDDHDK